MAYIGKTPVIGNFVKLDAISVVNGQASYTMQNGGSNFTAYNNVNQFLVSLNGILQAPTDSFTVSGSTITFASNLVTGDVIDFIIVLGNTLDVGVPSDNTVTTAKIVDGAVSAAKLGSGVGGKVLQVVSAIDTTTRSTTSTSYVTASNTLTQSITPSSTSSKILILASVTTKVASVDGFAGYGTIFRDGSDIATASNGMLIETSHTSAYAMGLNHISFLDSPSSTSSLTYDFRFKSESSSYTVQINTASTQSSLILMEIGA